MPNSTCKHIKEAQQSQCSREQATHISLSSTVLTTTPFPPAVRSEFETYLVGHNPVIQRVSNKSLVVATPVHPNHHLVYFMFVLVPTMMFSAPATSTREQLSWQVEQQLPSYPRGALTFTNHPSNNHFQGNE